jgi:Fe2+ transport system protein B
MALKVALIGNPNVGKSVIFNNLTGLRQHTGNWPGKTVEKKVGKHAYKSVEMDIVDLPGTYSLTSRAIDELIARDYIIEEKPDVVVDIIDASNIERNLYLTVLLLELEANLVVALNMSDMAEDKGYSIDAKKLSELLGVPVVTTVATRKKGMKELLEAIIEAANQRKKERDVVDYGNEIEGLIANVEKVIKKDKNLSEKYYPRWLAIKILENDKDVLEKIRESPLRKEILKSAKPTKGNKIP